MDIDRYYNFDWVNPTDAPDNKAVYAAEDQLVTEMNGLVAAPLNDPSVGPALLTGRAAAVCTRRVQVSGLRARYGAATGECAATGSR